MSVERNRMKDLHAARVRRGARAPGGVALHGRWEFVCRDKNGNEKWRDYIDNLVVNAGLNYILDAGLSGGTPITSWFIGLIDDNPTIAAGDTLASHGGWTEANEYSGNRKAWSDGGVSGQSVSNSASPAEFTFTSGPIVVAGAFLCSAASGTSGTLYSAGTFAGGDKTLSTDDVLEVTSTFTAAAA